MGLEIKDLMLETSGWQHFEGFIVVEEFNINSYSEFLTNLISLILFQINNSTYMQPKTKYSSSLAGSDNLIFHIAHNSLEVNCI